MTIFPVLIVTIALASTIATHFIHPIESTYWVSLIGAFCFGWCLAFYVAGRMR